MIKTTTVPHNFTEEEFLSKLGLNVGDAIRIEEVTIGAVHTLDGEEKRGVQVRVLYQSLQESVNE